MTLPDTLKRAPRELTNVILHGFLKEVVHVLSVQTIQGHADLVVEPLQPEFYKTTALPELPPPSPEGGLEAGNLLGIISKCSIHLIQPGTVHRNSVLKICIKHIEGLYF